MLSIRVCRGAVALIAAISTLWAICASAAENQATGNRATDRGRTAEYRPREAPEPAISPNHPLLPALDVARQWLDNARRNIRDFHCRVVKRERIYGELQDYYFIDMWVREEVRDGDRVIAPLAVFMEFLGPSSAVGRRLLFVEGRNEGKILVRKGGPRFEYIVTKVDPDGDNTKSESLLPIYQSGFIPLLAEIVATMERHMAADATGENTIVDRPQGAKVDGRPCHVVRFTHPEKQEDLEFHRGTFFIDAELGVPARIEKLDWPKKPGTPPPVIGEFNYTKVELNLGLTERMFDPKLLKAKSLRAQRAN